jgi:mycofactocin system glycosyltransferase
VTWRLAAGVTAVRARRGPALLARTPLRLVQVNDALAALVATGRGCEAGGPIIARTPGEARALDALAAKGLLVREPGPPLPPERLPSVSVVVPVKDRADELRRCLESLARLRHPREKLEVVVVDDGSGDGSAEVARASGATVVPSGGAGRGPAAARNRGAAAANGEILAFLDSDCIAGEDWLAELAGAFQDPGVVAVGGRVDGLHGASALDRYEAEMSSLCLGARGRTAGAGNDTFYLPSCNLLVRRDAFLAAGGFREALRVGEDVDLTWRLRDRGGRIAYLPRGAIRHEHRNRLASFLARRFDYGTSEGLLHVLHPARRKRMLVPPPLAVALLLVAAALLAGVPALAIPAAAVVLGDALGLGRRLAREGVRLPLAQLVLARLRAAGSLAYYSAFHLVRYHAVALVVGGVLWPRLGLLAAALAVGAAAVDHAVRRPALRFAPFFLLWLAEHLAYGAGVFRGCVRAGTFGSYRPGFSSGPTPVD